MKPETADELAENFVIYLKHIADAAGIGYSLPAIRFAEREEYADINEWKEISAVRMISDLEPNPITVQENCCTITTHMPDASPADIVDFASMAAGTYLAYGFLSRIEQTPFWYRMNGGKEIERVTTEQAENTLGRIVPAEQMVNHFCRAVYAANSLVSTISWVMVLQSRSEALDDKTILALSQDSLENPKLHNSDITTRVVKTVSLLANYALISKGAGALKEAIEIPANEFHNYLNMLYRSLENTKP